MDIEDTCKLVIITDTYVGIPGGSEHHLFNFLSGVSNVFQVDAFQLIPTGNPMLPDGKFLNNKNVTLHSKPISRILSIKYILFLLGLLRHIKKNNTDLVISYHEKSEITNFVLKFLLGERIVSITSKRDLGFKLRGRLRSVVRYISRHFDAVTAPSHSIKNWLVTDFGVKLSKISVIKNGVDLLKYPHQAEDDRLRIKRKLGMDNDLSIMTCVGCLKPVKGHEYLIEAFSKFVDAGNDHWILVLLGDGELRLSLEQQARELGIFERVQFLGYQNNVYEWLSISDVMVSATLSEGLSNALIEGCAAGCPIIATNVGGNPEIITDKENGILVPSQNSCELAAAMKVLTVDGELMKSMGKKSRHRAISEFSNSAMVSALEALYLKFKKSNSIISAGKNK